MPPDPNVHTGVGVWIERGADLLMVQRGGTGQFASHGRGTWSVPGGWLDFGETPEETAAREAMEETGVSVRPVERMGYTVAPSDDGSFHIVTLFVRCEWVCGEPTITEPEKCPAVEWVPLGEVQGRTLFSPLRHFLDRTA